MNKNKCCEPGCTSLANNNYKCRCNVHCTHYFCDNCYTKSLTEEPCYRGWSNTCIWFDLG